MQTEPLAGAAGLASYDYDGGELATLVAYLPLLGSDSVDERLAVLDLLCDQVGGTPPSPLTPHSSLPAPHSSPRTSPTYASHPSAAPPLVRAQVGGCFGEAAGGQLGAAVRAHTHAGVPVLAASAS